MNNKQKLITVMLVLCCAGIALGISISEEFKMVESDHFKKDEYHLSEKLFKCNQCNYQHRAILKNNLK